MAPRLMLAFGCALLAATLGCGGRTHDPGAQYERAQRAIRDGNYPRAAKWYRRAAEQGHADAQFALGSLYEVGAGVPQDYAAMVEWMHRAAAQGHPRAQFALGLIYSRAIYWGPNEAALARSPWRRFLARFGQRGPPTPLDRTQAYMWFTLAAEQGHPQARQHLILLGGNLPPAQIAAARRRAADWRPSP